MTGTLQPASAITIRELTEDEFLPLFRQHRQAVFGHDHSYALQDLYTETENENIEHLGRAMGAPYKLHLGAFDTDNNFVGWSWGTQENNSVFYMVNSGVLNEYRRRGIYRALLERAVATLAAQGFQVIYSRHCATNNAVLIPKLKAGFIIAKLEIDDRYGVLVHLHYYVNETRRRIMDYRAGQARPDETIRKLFKI